MILLWSGLALAAPCPDVAALVDEAEAAFDEAEVKLARSRIAQAHDALTCQAKAVPRGTLLDLYHLDALASVAAEDDRAALYAIIRAVTLDPDAAPPPDVGPELISQHEQWAERLRADKVRMTTTSPDVTVWVDGRAIGQDPLETVAGEHLVQARDGEAWTSRVVDVAVGSTYEGLPIAIEAVPEPEPEPIAPPTAPVPPEPPGRQVKPGVVVAGVSLAIIGGGLVGVGGVMERTWRDDPYLDPTYGDCSRDQACWEDARADRIGADARRANAMYLTGYGVGGVGIGLLGIQLAVAVSDGGGGLRLGGRW